MLIQLDANGEIVDSGVTDTTIEYVQGSGVAAKPAAGVTTSPSTIGGDPARTEPYTDEQLAEALNHTQGQGSPEQAELDRMEQRAVFCETKANEVKGFEADGKTPIYVRNEMDRAQLLRQAKGIRDGLPLQLIMSNRAIATRYLDGQAKIAHAQQEAANHEALVKRGKEIAFELQATAIANGLIKRDIGGNRR